MAKRINMSDVKTQINSKMTNTDVLNYLKNGKYLDSDLLSRLQKTYVDEGTGQEKTVWRDMKEIADMFADFPKHANSFIDTLINRCVKTMFFNNRWKNRLAVLQKGTLKAGDSIQQIFVDMSQRVGFEKNFKSDGGTPENNLIGKNVPVVHVDYISVNERYKYKVSVSIEQIQQAFIDEYGLTSLANELIQANYEASEWDNYMDMYKLLFSKEVIENDGEGVNINEKGIIYQALEKKAEKPKMIVPCGNDIKELIKQVRSHAGKLSFKTTDYNLSNIKRHTDKKKLVFLTDPEIIAEIDINVLAQAFNVSSAEINVRTIDVHELPQGGGDGVTDFKGRVLGVLMDEDLVQFWYKLNVAESFRNNDTLTTNYFLHQWVVNGLCKFCNFVIFTNDTK